MLRIIDKDVKPGQDYTRRPEIVRGNQTMSTSCNSSGRSITRFEDPGALIEREQLQEDVLCNLEPRDGCLNASTYRSLLKRWAGAKNLVEGRKVHMHMIDTGFEADIYLLTAVLSMYCKCGSLMEARKVFDAMQQKDVIACSSMLTGYAKQGASREGFKLYEKLQDDRVRFDSIMYVSIVSICASLGDLEKGKAVHRDITKSGITTDIMLESNLVHMYARCGSMKLAHEVFNKMAVQNIVSWNSLIAGYAWNGNIVQTFELFQKMQQHGVKPNASTFISLLSACTGPAALLQGRSVHADIIKAGLEADVRVGTALVSMFSKCGSTQEAREVFDKIRGRDVISFTAMIEGYAEHGPYREAMEIFHQMQHEGVHPDVVTFTCLLKACANQASLQEARWVHAKIVASTLESDLRIRSSLLNAYTKCGSVVDAYKIFSMMPERDVVTWSAMIVGLGQHGHGREALEHFHRMISEGVRPNQVTYIGVLSACSHAGLVEEGLRYFHSMTKDHGILPEVEHFGCIVDLLGRAGHLEEAENVVNKMPQTPAAVTWAALLSACRLHGNVKMAECAAQYRGRLEPQNAAVYLSLAHVYATAGMWQNATLLRKLMEDRGVTKELECSWIEVEGSTHECVAV